MKISFIYEDKETKTLKQYLKSKSFSDDLILKCRKANKSLCINNIYTNRDDIIPNKNDRIEITLPDEESNINVVKGKLDIVYEDDYILLLNKPHNLSVIGTKAHYDNHLSGMIINYYNEIDLKSTVHFVNRLDKDTSGLILVAKHQYIHSLLSKENIVKKYLLDVEGKLDKENGIIKTGIEKIEGSIKRKVTEDNTSITKYKVIEYKNNISTIEATLLTGKTHQLRVHFASINHPIIGDTLYNGKNDSYLHLVSNYLEFIHPITKEKLVFTI